MPSALLHVFSGTGNSALAAGKLADELTRHGWQVDTRSIENGFYTGKPGDADLHVFLFPIYATSVPHIMARYMRHMPRGRGVRAAVLSTNGRISTRWRDGHQGWALHQARLLLKCAGYAVGFSDTIDMPHDITVGIPPRKEVKNRAILDVASMQIEKAAERIATGQTFHRKLFPLIFLLSVPFWLGFTLLGRRAFGKLFAGDPGCTGCGACAAACPAHNIRLIHGRPHFGWRCEACLRCINRCPSRSIQVPALRLIAMLFLMVFWNPAGYLRALLPAQFLAAIGSFGAGLLDFAVVLATGILLMEAFDWLHFALGFVPGVRRLVGWGHTRLYGRYDGKKFTI